jgi:hypothetical protein
LDFSASKESSLKVGVVILRKSSLTFKVQSNKYSIRYRHIINAYEVEMSIVVQNVPVNTHLNMFFFFVYRVGSICDH